MSGFLLDTNILSNLIRNPAGLVAARMSQVVPSLVCTSIIAAAELRYGAEKKGSSRLAGRIHGLLSRLQILPFEAPAELVYGRLRAQLERVGAILGSNDLFIAAHALSLGHTLVTDNQREFSRVPELAIENWIR